ncbi:hypothetical protein [Thomasclavelia cocleata]|uniref:hypothetical protein n=1 Tax=Thomasclavelia cocleata TaxID=69824 RepID=UPI0026168D35|nr:hypothetical protein [Thomasclavelia cocleata]
MKINSYDQAYNIHKQRKIKVHYVDLLCEILLLTYEFSFKDKTKKDVLNELPGIREFKSTEVNKIYNDSLKMLELKYQIKVLNDSPLKFKKESEM